MAIRRQERGRERGAAAVEFAIIFPLLLLLIGGVIDFGRAYFTQVVLANAAREGARAAVVGSGAWHTRTTAAAAGLDSSNLNIAPPSTAKCASGSPFTVTVGVDFEWIVLGPAMNLIPGGAAILPPELSSTATMQCVG